jgi:predicted permease
MNTFPHDFRLALRRLALNPGFTVAAIVTLALAIGANTTTFTALNTIFLRELPVDRPGQLVFFNAVASGGQLPAFSYPNYRDLRDRNSVLEGLIAYRIAPVSLSRGGTNSRLWSYLATGNYFDVLGVKAAAGRVFNAADDLTPGAHPVAVISYACWQSRFGGDPAIAGSTARINGNVFNIIGVAQQGFSGTELFYTPDLWVPMSMYSQIEPGSRWLERRAVQNIFVLGRLKQGLAPPQAEAALNVIAADLGREYPRENAGLRIALSPPGLAGNMLRGPVAGFTAVLMGVAGLVLLTACVNLAGLLLARATDRRRDTAIRLALGASRAQLIRQHLIESLVLALAGGAAGIMLAAWLTSLLNAWRPPFAIPIGLGLALDAQVVTFAVAISVVTTLLFGIAPALQATGGVLLGALKNEAPSARLRRWHLRDVLAAAQVALSVILLIGSVLVIRSLQHALSLNLGFNPRQAALVSFDLGIEGYSEERARAFQRQVLERVSAIPGITSAALANSLPLSLNWNNNSIYVEGKPEPRAAQAPLASIFSGTPSYFKTMQTRFIAGREFDERDNRNSPAVAIVNHAFARRLLPGEDAIGKRFRFSPRGSWLQIVGIVEDGKYRSLSEGPTPVVFLPMWQGYESLTTIVARSPIPERDLINHLRGAVLALDPGISFYEANSLSEQLGPPLLPARLAASLLSGFGLLALVLAATGVYGAMAYAVARRTREIGIRVAIGALPRQVLTAVFRRMALLAVIGASAGVVIALIGGRFFQPILYGIKASDPWTFVIALVLVGCVTLAACWNPARRALRVDPLTALREE